MLATNRKRQIKQVQKFKYQKNVMTNYGKCDRRIGIMIDPFQTNHIPVVVVFMPLCFYMLLTEIYHFCLFQIMMLN